MRNIYLIFNTIFLALLFSACGGGGSSDSSIDSDNTKISVFNCNTSTPMYTDIKTGDLLVNETNSTVVNIIHNTEGTKKVCAVTGAAYLLRNK